ncbi:hypothetical protein HN709_02575 [Candidatus Peregrinibacteria bacterium]|jgi:hypothetical protein|nr:hypothetical protein [Candidatus Peregrinibacteria bacterium]MBT7736548.1 hypothetical protein [Candidatus Peregrinibacteria bacterium]
MAIAKIENPVVVPEKVGQSFEYLKGYLRKKILAKSSASMMGVQDEVVEKNIGTINHSPEANYFNFEDLVDLWMHKFGVSNLDLREEILADEELRGLFVELTDKELSFKLSPSDRQKYLVRIKEIVFGHLEDEQSADSANKAADVNKVDDVYNVYAVFERVAVLREAVMKTGNKKAIEIWITGEEEIKEQYRNGKIKSFGSYFSKANVVYQKAIDEANDEELNAVWKDYSDSQDDFKDSIEEYDEWSESGSSSSDSEQEGSSELSLSGGEEIIENPHVVEEAVASVKASGIDVVVSDAGLARVDFGDDFWLDMSFVESPGSGKKYFYIRDENSSLGVLKVEADKVLPALDERHVDAYFSEQMAPVLKDPNLISEIPDGELVPLLSMIIGDGEERGLGIGSEDRAVLQKLAEFLAADSSLDMGLMNKIDFMNQYIGKRDVGMFFAKRLLTGELVSFDEYYAEVTSKTV